MPRQKKSKFNMQKHIEKMPEWFKKLRDYFPGKENKKKRGIE